MALKLSLFTTASNPISRGDMFNEAINCYSDLADEVIIVDGGNGNHVKATAIPSPWPYEFDWPFIGQQFQRGYEAATGDWVIHADLDFIFHEKDFHNIRQALKDYDKYPAISFYKWQFTMPDRYNLKSRLPLAINKKLFNERMKFNGGGDLCQPTFDGNELNLNEIPEAGLPFYNYEKMTKTFSQIVDDVWRMDKAYQKHFGKWLYSQDGTQLSAYDGWMAMMKGRFNKPSEKIALNRHPKYVQETIKNLKPDQFGYDGLGHLLRNNYA